MAKKVKKSMGSSGELPDPFKNFLAADTESHIISESETDTAEFIPTGSLMLDAAISGRLGGWVDENGEKVNGGIPSNRITLICGESQTGKSLIAINICREAQKLGYNILYLDSEGAIDKQTIERLGCDPTRFIVRPVSNVTETTNVILKLINNLNEEEEQYGTHNKFLIVLDSLGNLSSIKETTDLANCDTDNYLIPKDLTKSQNIKSLFRVCTSQLSRLQVPFIVTSHVYQSMNMYSSVKTQISGGSGAEYNASVILELTRKKAADDKESEKRASEAVASEDITKKSYICNINIRKSRLTIGRRISLLISMFKKLNKYQYIGGYCDWDRCLIAPGKIITEKEYEKLSDADKAKVKTFEYEGETKYALLKDTIRSVVIGRKNLTVPFDEFLTEKVFDNDFLKFMDLEIIRPAFQLPSIQQLEEMEKKENNSEINALN